MAGDWMLQRKPPPELGRLVDRHRPLNPLFAWALIAATSVPLPLWFMATDGMPLPVGAVTFALSVPLLGSALAQPMLLEHRLYEHGLMFRTLMVGTPIFIVPHYTIRPREVSADPKPEVAQFEVVDDPQQRRCLRARPSVRLFGLDPRPARMLGKGKLTWDEAGRQGVGKLPGGTSSFSGQSIWVADYRDAERQAKLITHTLLASQERLPYFKH